MLLVDLNQVLISNVMQHINMVGKKDISEDMIRHIVLNSLRAYNKQFRTKYGDRKSTRLNSSHSQQSRMPSSA